MPTRVKHRQAQWQSRNPVLGGELRRSSYECFTKAQPLSGDFLPKGRGGAKSNSSRGPHGVRVSSATESVDTNILPSGRVH
ncbi:hypothetical protein BURKHO8Y_450020 [Burkholderia sp. 8Y]|nr:hypothetical protein BURKHO8Y_450020 [Burkholderia sp. 8Y]